jgi:hypothetical protein
MTEGIVASLYLNGIYATIRRGSKAAVLSPLRNVLPVWADSLQISRATKKPKVQNEQSK